MHPNTKMRYGASSQITVEIRQSFSIVSGFWLIFIPLDSTRVIAWCWVMRSSLWGHSVQTTSCQPRATFLDSSWVPLPYGGLRSLISSLPSELQNGCWGMRLDILPGFKHIVSPSVCVFWEALITLFVVLCCKIDGTSADDTDHWCSLNGANTLMQCFVLPWKGQATVLNTRSSPFTLLRFWTPAHLKYSPPQLFFECWLSVDTMWESEDWIDPDLILMPNSIIIVCTFIVFFSKVASDVLADTCIWDQRWRRPCYYSFWW